MKSGIYKIVNLITNKFYIGSSVDMIKRWHVHLTLLRHNKHKNPHLQHAFNKYGEISMQFQIVSIIENNEDMLKEEQRLIDKHFGNPNCYNLRNGVTELVGKKNPFYGKYHTDGAKQKMSVIKKLKYSGENHPQYGIPKSTETKKKISATRKGQHSGHKHPSLDTNTYTFLNGIETFVGIQYDFCKKYNLSRSAICWLIKGKNKSVKGWRLV